jgi:hypothetical protein
MLITINERQHMHNDYTCYICDDPAKPVVGAAYKQRQQDFPTKHYMFRYCADCALKMAQQLANVVHPNYQVVKK